MERRMNGKREMDGKGNEERVTGIKGGHLREHYYMS